jgi:zinc transport system ATP-binding protein
MSSEEGWFAVIETSSLTFRYAQSAPIVLESISMHIQKGDYISVVGENGSGKSTLIRLFLGLLKPNSGSLVNNARRIGYVPQKKEFLNSQFPLTVYELLNSYRAILGLKDRQCVTESLERVQMVAFRNALIGTLSGGQAQKVFIARALIGSPDLIILDEPSSGVDMKSQKEMYSVIRKLNRENQITIVSVEHNLDAAVMNSTLIFHLAEGHGHMCNPEKYVSEFLQKEPEAQNV